MVVYCTTASPTLLFPARFKVTDKVWDAGLDSGFWTYPIHVWQKALEDMDRKSKQQEAQIRALKAKLEQRSVATSWETGHVTGDLGLSTDRVTTVEKKYEDLERQVGAFTEGKKKCHLI